MTLMIVEDSQDLQDLLKQLFVSEGYTVAQAYNGAEALDQLQGMTVLPCLILLDIMMPVMDGLEFRKIQMNESRLAAVPVIVMSADASFGVKARALGVSEFVNKPIVDVEKLVDIIARSCRAQ